MVISGQEIHLWYAYFENIDDPRLLSQYYNLLNSEERSRWGRFKFEKDRHQYLVTRAMVRYVLSQYQSEIYCEEWNFKTNRYGKPYITNHSIDISLHFNVSHTKELVVMAVTINREIGIDAEYLPRAGRMLDIAGSFFSPLEIEQLNELPKDDQRDRFVDLWTLKEAYIKACGKGLAIPLDDFSISISRQGKISICFNQNINDQAEYWRFWQNQPTDSHKVSVAIKSGNINENYSVLMRNTIPLLDIVEIEYPIKQGYILRNIQRS